MLRARRPSHPPRRRDAQRSLARRGRRHFCKADSPQNRQTCRPPRAPRNSAAPAAPSRRAAVHSHPAAAGQLACRGRSAARRHFCRTRAGVQDGQEEVGGAAASGGRASTAPLRRLSHRHSHSNDDAYYYICSARRQSSHAHARAHRYHADRKMRARAPGSSFSSASSHLGHSARRGCALHRAYPASAPRLVARGRCSSPPPAATLLIRIPRRRPPCGCRRQHTRPIDPATPSARCAPRRGDGDASTPPHSSARAVSRQGGAPATTTQPTLRWSPPPAGVAARERHCSACAVCGRKHLPCARAHHTRRRPGTLIGTNDTAANFSAFPRSSHTHLHSYGAGWRRRSSRRSQAEARVLPSQPLLPFFPPRL